MNAISRSIKINPYLLFPLLSTFFVVHFLFFIDEGYYSFAWMKSYGAWIVYWIYFGIFFGIQYFMGRFIFKQQEGMLWASLMFFIGLPTAFSLAYTLFS